MVIHVDPAEPAFTAPVLQKTVNEGTALKLSDFTLPEGFTWKDAEQSVAESGYYDAVYRKDNTGNYLDADAEVYIDLTIVSEPAETVITAPVLQKTVSEGTALKLSDFTLPEGFAWKNGELTVTESGYYDAVYHDAESGTETDTRVYIDLDIVSEPVESTGCSGTVMGMDLYAAAIAAVIFLMAVVCLVRRKD